ncbi:MAG: hypothetical protein A2821_04650 [Candidatus Magasanikbacteria bacterium RIFCSPHIGHO2_01_FULL_41_23]|uniref:Transcription regulator TrmB N-terminal domain-containing protein n=1 Tax=Candidatus Magasanikbacteria bacterium RIFCSPLOWO2_01_FULL_40_15 TaxID=1798686 RepID=A0A1F6N4S5_9BACT|nr:MAG: hypothetical protein A2821_04650 [Candidatus Magasanikbacteria bacterium RIFCSPHIGHO2_01_FULL_41_23]OGH67212.1 MAG: hypothetical protein A3C66_02960 [Candidatus Magasanikbacteria bacterium RIFCSPHIGHO2_02_FULL_41_35]OGH75422.1 MAG: hypothetical protein A3F22_01180 [Candidatus Magasanikbacteria bacterium RIFCSPHIGHO2_12_FULL_41_16]OGH78748.1 MAG: hypothetical protein A2983_04600 [Candidatus Magasanikbacteria bacterium RIFCSPLOWO2_01_FULL_40_15]
MKNELLKKIGFSDKTAQVYMGILQLGPSSVRNLAEFCGLNRGSTYDSLKWLGDRGLVSFYEKKSKQHFVAESPARLRSLIKEETHNLEQASLELERSVPELEALYNRGGDRPIARYFSSIELPAILNDVLLTCEQSQEPKYRAYSTEGIRDHLYANFSTFSDVRVAKNISVRVIALGEGGELRGLDERKWLSAPETKPTYIILYPSKAAYISLNVQNEAVGVVIENDGVYETQVHIFDALWKTL